MSTDRESLFEPGKLWSLWDMLQIEAKPFLKAVTALTSLSTLIRESRIIERAGMDEIVGAASAKPFRNQLKDLRKAAEAFQATVTQGEVEFILKRLSQTTWREVEPLIDGVIRVFAKEITGAKLFALDTGAAAYYARASEVFGEVTVTAFPKAEYDLEEAGKSLAVARNTACVFHLMRAMETALQGICASIGVVNVDKRWGFLLTDIDNAVKTMSDEHERSRWSLARTNLWHVKETWRNDTMHPGDKYTDAEAREVMDAVKVFLRSLAPLAVPAE